MPIAKTEELYELIKSLTKAEKRNFRLYAKRHHEDNEMMYLKLFDILEKQKALNESDVRIKLFFKNSSQYSNVKRHLYTQIIGSLQKLHTSKKASIEIRQLMNYASILYSKGLYKQALKILDKASVLANKTQYEILHLHIIEYQKLIESRHITRSGPNRYKELIEDASRLSGIVGRSIKLSNLRILLHSQYIKYGHVKNEKEEEQLSSLFETHLSTIPLANSSPIEKVYLFQSYVWYYYILLDFSRCYKYSIKWINLFLSNPGLIKRDPGLFMRGYHYVLTAAYSMGKASIFEKHLEEFELYRKSNYKQFDRNNQVISFLYVHMGRLNNYILHKDYANGVKIIPRTLSRFNRYSHLLDNHRVLIFYYKIAWLYLNGGKTEEALYYLNKIKQMNKLTLRKDLQAYAYIMHIMAHYDLGNFDLLQYLTHDSKTFITKLDFESTLTNYALEMFFKCVKTTQKQREIILNEYQIKFRRLRKNKYEKRALIYLEIDYWLARKYEERT